MTGVLALSRLRLRTGRVGLLGAPLLIGALVAATAASIASLYTAAEDRAGYAASIGSSASGAAMNGRGYDLDTIGGIIALEVGLMGQILVGVCGFGLAIRHTRREEEGGLAELVTATRIAPLAPLLSACLAVGLACLATGALAGAAVGTFARTVTGGIWYGAGIALSMAVFAGVGLLAGQLAQSARTAWSLSLGVLLACFLLRAVVDGQRWSAVWLSPLGWPAEIRPFGTAPQVAPALGLAALTLVLTTAAILVARTRDLGAGVVAPRPGPARASARLSHPVGLATRQVQVGAIGWVVLAVLLAGVFGVLSNEVAETLEANPQVLEALGVSRATDLVGSLATLFVALFAAAAGLQVVGRLAQEESSGRLGLVASTRVRQPAWWLAWGGTALVVAATVLLTGALVLGLSTASVTGRSSDIGVSLGAGIGYLAPVGFVVALGLLARGATARPAAVGWLVVAWAAVVGMLAETLRLPGWARDLSPLHAVGTLPIDDASLPVTVGLAAAAVVLLAATPALAGRRDLAAG